ncbi:MAG TPA: septum site-determining protein MinC, partial [Pseudomonas sp.]|nr:septum site-determining protein MinC [Pseudomonas sp.]
MSQADLPDQSPAFQLKGSMLAITVLELASNDIERLDEQLAAKVEQAPDFFNNTPLVLALDKLPEAAREIDIKALVALCRKHRLRTLALRASEPAHIEAAA